MARRISQRSLSDEGFVDDSEEEESTQAPEAKEAKEAKEAEQEPTEEGEEDSEEQTEPLTPSLVGQELQPIGLILIFNNVIDNIEDFTPDASY